VDKGEGYFSEGRKQERESSARVSSVCSERRTLLVQGFYEPPNNVSLQFRISKEMLHVCRIDTM